MNAIVDATEDAAVILNAGASIADPKENPAKHGDPYAIVPPGAALEYLLVPSMPPRRAGTVKLSDAASFLEYWKRQQSPCSYIYGSMRPAQFLAVFDEHALEQPNWREHQALYALEHSEEWNTWAKMDRKAFDGNEAFAYWLEDNLPDLKSPSAAQFMEIALNIKVKQGAVFGNKVNLNDGNIVLQYANTVEGSTGDNGTLSIPEKFVIEIPVFKGLEAAKHEIEARFRYRLTSGALKIQYELVRPAKIVEQAFKDLLAEIQEKSGTRVLFGTPS